MNVTGTVATRRATEVARRTCIRSCSTRKSGIPESLSAMTSPSTSRSRSPHGDVATSGHAAVTSLSLRLVSRIRPSRVSARIRIPSHFTSCDHPAPTGTSVPGVASIGRMGTSCPPAWSLTVQGTVGTFARAHP